MLDDLPQNQAPLANQTQPDNRGRCSIESHYHKTENLLCKNFGKCGGLVVSTLDSEFCVLASRIQKLFSCSAQLRLRFILLINVKMPTIVGILTFMSRINYLLFSTEPEFSTNFDYFNIYEQLKFHAQLS